VHVKNIQDHGRKKFRQQLGMNIQNIICNFLLRNVDKLLLIIKL